MSCRPDFIGIGMERAGSSWLFYMLASHPNIWVPPLKELHYFDSIDPGALEKPPRYKRHLLSRMKHKIAPLMQGQLEKRPELFKMSYVDNILWDGEYFARTMNDDWYRGLFHEKFTKGRVCGEISPAYSTLSDNLISHACTHFPDALFLLSLRHPSERMRSGMVHYFVRQQGRDLAQVTEKEMQEWLDGSVARARSSVSGILEAWLKHVSPERMHIVNFSDIKTDPEKIVRALYQKLGVDSASLPPQDAMKGKINTYTPPELTLPGSVQERLLAIGESEMERVKTQIPAIVASWRAEESKI